MEPVGVMHLTGSLEAGGAEKVAVTLVNMLPRRHYRPYLCTTRVEGPLADLVAPDVVRLRLGRRWRFDAHAVRKLRRFISTNRIKILHAHNSCIFIAKLVALFPPFPAVIWHNHTGACVNNGSGMVWLYRRLVGRISGVITVSQALAEWSRSKLRIPSEHIWYIPNFITTEESTEFDPLPGTPGNRIVCIANLHPPKDHVSLIRAMARVVVQVPDAHLLLVGSAADPAYTDLVREEIVHQGLEKHVSLLGFRRDVSTLTRACEVGVLSSLSEGFPLALLEYGIAGLATVATDVGECHAILDGGRSGILVPPESPNELAEALLLLLRSPELRIALGKQFGRRVSEQYSSGSIVEQICRVYETVLAQTRQKHAT